MDVEVRGSPLVSGPALFVSNHVSYLDVTAIGSVVDGSFVSRADVRDWLIFGFLSRLQKTVFIERRPRYARQQLLELSGRLGSGDRLILFPEGTSSDGNMILPFKSTLFAVAETQVDGRSIPVRPISIAYTRLDGLPLGRLLRPIYAWYGDMDFAPTFGSSWAMAGSVSKSPFTTRSGSKTSNHEKCLLNIASRLFCAIYSVPFRQAH